MEGPSGLKKGPELFGDKREPDLGCEAPPAGHVLALWAPGKEPPGTVPGLRPCVAGSHLAPLCPDPCLGSEGGGGGLSSLRNMIPPSAPSRPPSPGGWGHSSASCLFPVRPGAAPHPTPLLFHARASVLVPRTPPWAPPPSPGQPLVTLRPSEIKKGQGPSLAQAWPSPRECQL